MRRAVINDHRCAEDAVTDQGPALAASHESLFAREKEFFADGAAFDLRFESILVGHVRSWFHETDDAGEVAGAARLLLEGVVEAGVLCHSFAPGDLRLAGLDLDFVFAAHALDVDVEVEFAHAGDDCLLGLGVDVDTKGGIFAGEAVHGFGEVGGVFVVFGADGEGDDRFGDVHGCLLVGGRVSNFTRIRGRWRTGVILLLTIE